jgi:hypothetical protein
MVVLASVGFGQNWEISPILPGSPITVSIATDELCLPRVAFGGGRRLGYASWDGTGWNVEYPDTNCSSGVSEADLCLDGNDIPHFGYVLAGWPEPSELRYAYRDGDTWRIDTVAGGMAPGSLVLGAFALARDRTPHMVFVDSVTVEYAHKAGDTWDILTVPAYQADSLRGLRGASLALDTNDRPGVAISWSKYGGGGVHDSLWLSFFEFDGSNWHRFDVDSAEGLGVYDFWHPGVQYDPATDLFHVVYRAGVYAIGKGNNWHVEGANVSVGDWWYGFALHQARPHIACSNARDPLQYQWRWAGGWETELVVNKATDAVSIAVDKTGRPHIAFASAGGETLFYARRLFVGTEEPAPTIVQPKVRLLVHPNPARRVFTLEFRVRSRTTAAIRLCDALGRTVWSQEEKVYPGQYYRRFRLSTSISPGVYFLRVESGQLESTEKVILQ